MIPVPGWLAFIGFLGNTAVALMLWNRGDVLSLLFAFAAGISFITVLDRLTAAVRTAETDATHAD